jgi:hypothetical protein
MNALAEVGQGALVVPSWDRQASGYSCPSPVFYDYQGEVWKRDCGSCPRCVAKKKRDTAGRAAAEAFTAAEVVVWTLTYAPGHAGAVDFETIDRQKWIKAVRDWLYRQARRQVGAPKRMSKRNAEHVRAYWKGKIEEILPKVRYIGCGERGKRNTKRCHWHCVLFLSRPSGFRSTPRQPDGKPGREHSSLWRFGWVNIHVLPAEMSAKLKATRYAVKYQDKSRTPRIDGLPRPEKAEAKFFRSNATPLGFDYLTEEARRTARAGLPITGKYRVPGVWFSAKAQVQRGRDGRLHRGGSVRHDRLVEHQLTGRMRDHFIAAYREEWQRVRPDRPVPMTPWMLRYDGEADLDCGLGRRIARGGWKPRGEVVAPIPERTFGHAGWIIVKRWGHGPRRGEEIGVIDVHPDGEADFIDADGVEHPVEGAGIRHLVPDLLVAQHEHIEGRLALLRGSGWISARQRRAAQHDRGVAQAESIKRWAKRGPNPMPAHLPPYEPVTGLLRQLAMNGLGHVPGRVVKLREGSRKQSAFIKGPGRLLRPVAKHEA